MPSETVENYLKAILVLGEESPTGEATLSRIAALVGVTPGTATAMVKRLAAARLVRYRRYGAVALSAAGRRAALDVQRRHRIVEQFLVEVVGLDWSEVHAEAERLEHAISPRLLDRLDEMLGRPRFDPHGDPIPDARGREARQRPLRPLGACSPGSEIRVARVVEQERDFLRRIARAGLRPGTRLRVERSDAAKGRMALRLEDGTTTTLSTADAEALLVREEGADSGIRNRESGIRIQDSGIRIQGPGATGS